MTRNKLFVKIALLFCFHITYAQQTLKLWYDHPSQKWTDALPLGNGRLGAMVFGGVELDRIQFNEETLWNGGPRNYNRKGASTYLAPLRELLYAGKQKEAEKLAEEQFMGLKSNEGKKAEWVKKMTGATSFASPGFDDSQWKLMQIPSYEGWEAVGFDGLDGSVWLRTSFEMPAGWRGQDLVLDLNRIRDQDLTYVNGKLVGSMESTEARKYVVPKDVLVNGRNVIAVQVLNFNDKGGIAGYKDTTRHIGIYRQPDESSKISLNGHWKYFIQDNDPPAVPKYQADYQPFGDLWLKFKGHDDYSNYKRELDLSDAIARTSYDHNGVYFTRTYFSSQPHQALVVHLDASKKGSISFELSLTSPHLFSKTIATDQKTIQLSLKVRNGALRGETMVRLEAVNGNVTIDGNKLVVTNADAATIYLTAATNYKTYNDISGDPLAICRSRLATLKGKSLETIRTAHVREYQEYFNRFSLDLGKTENDVLPTDVRIEKFAGSSDPSLVALYAQYGRYLLISSSRPGTGPANLQGIWNDLMSPPWGSKYTTNINVEMNYWPAELLNLSSTHQPLFSMIDDLSKTGRETAREYYKAPGWVLHHNTDLWRGTAPINASNHGIWVGGSGWLSHHLWEHYLFTQDKDFLRSKAYPVMKEAALFYKSFLTKDPVTGWLISTPSNSPEQGGLVAGPSMDHEIIRSLFKAVIEASTLLNADEQLRTELQQKLKQIAPNQVGRYGQLQEWLKDVDDTSNKHRHVSHLWAVYPGNEINWDETPAFMKAARQSLLYRGDAATGWSLGWKLNLWARFKEGDHAYKLLQMLLSPAEKGGAGSYHNLFDAHPPFQIDGNFGGAAGIGEMLVQSHTGFIDLLPALPSALPQGRVTGICARGGFRLDMEWKNGKLVKVDIISLAGQDIHLRYNDKTIRVKTVKGQVYHFNHELQAVR